MKGFFKTLLASFIGIFLAMFLGVMVLVSVVGALSASTGSTPSVPKSTILKISDITIGEQDAEGDLDPASLIMGGGKLSADKQLGILKAIRAIENAATDPAVKFIYINPTNVSADLTTMEEFRNALVKFKESGKAIITYAESYSQTGYYLCSVADKIYINPHGSNSVYGVASSLTFFKGALDKLGVEIQLIRHGKYKSAGEQFVNRDISPANREQNQAMISSLWNTIATAICESRDIDIKTFNNHINNLTASDAENMVKASLADATMTRDKMIEELTGLFGVEDEKDVKMTSLADYAQATVKPNVKASDKIAIIYANGEIKQGSGEGICSDDYAKIVSDVRKDSTIKAVVLRVNSPGGDAIAAEIIRNELELLRKVKPVVVSYGGYAASGGYWISAEGDKIFTNESTLTGSIGVFSMVPNFGKIVKEKAHVNIVNIKSNDHADMMTITKGLDKEEVAHMQNSVEHIYDTFLSIVSNGRDMTTEEVDAIAQGRVWSGTDAIKVGLTDEIGTIVDAIQYTENISGLKEYQLVEYPKSKSQVEKLMESFGQAKSSMDILSNPEAAVEDMVKELKKISKTVYARMEYNYVFEN